GRSVEDVALAVASLESETLKRFGIRLRTVGDQFTFQFRDKAGDALEVVAKGADAAREALTDIFGQKFGGSLVKASDTIAGKWSTFKDAVQESFATIGMRLLPAMSRVLTIATDALNSLIGSGRLEKLGDRLAKGAEDLIDWLLKIKPTFTGVGNALKSAAVEAGKLFAVGVLKAVGSLPGMLVRGVGDALKGIPVSSPEVQSALSGTFPISNGSLPTPVPSRGFPAPPPGSIAAQNAASAASRITGNSLNNPSFVKVVNQNETGFGN
ncbi:MAG: hypothetical protein OEN49_08720, partial [Gammaproteobacteria bacterium]|nr:hypothetical protein [Gammaproteobacteria bacterium]